MVKIEVERRGGKLLEAYIRNAGKGGVHETAIGFQGYYPDENRTPVAFVAALNEFGTDRIPSRPFMRSAITDVEDDLRRMLRQRLDPLKMIIDRPLAQAMGDLVKTRIRNNIIEWTQPPNAPLTIALKGRNDPLVHTRRMLNSIFVEVRGGLESTVTPTSGFFQRVLSGISGAARGFASRIRSVLDQYRGINL